MKATDCTTNPVIVGAGTKTCSSGANKYDDTRTEVDTATRPLLSPKNQELRKMAIKKKRYGDSSAANTGRSRSLSNAQIKGLAIPKIMPSHWRLSENILCASQITRTSAHDTSSIKVAY